MRTDAPRKSRYISLALACAQFVVAGDPAADLLGRWRATETSKGGIGAMYEFRADGTVNFSPGAVVEMPYRVEDNFLIMAGETQGSEQKTAIEFVGSDKFRLKRPTGVPGQARAVELLRQGTAPDRHNPIIGEWIEHREMGGRQLEAHWLFSGGGKVLLLIPFVTSHGHFSIRGSAIHMEFLPPSALAQTPMNGTFEVSKDVLVLKLPKRTESGERIGEYRYARY
jgi:hypothetical protein